ncbi:hypothetical protein OG233_23115 [Streptomyces sp. NBC_01218]|uniref:hypothetical protein n=1 Tax=Streptomyces sp. NBC_01218 TaxID=2903780 RepID=UPI002E15EB29|nr:hypothetical protein OG233_23115 [Streptomyces sp. NBC_01218]
MGSEGGRRARGLILCLAAVAWMSAGPAVADEGDGGSAPATRADGTPLLRFARPSPVTGVRPGDTVPLEILVKNAGDGPADRVTLYINGSSGTAFAEKYSNCVQRETPAQDEGPAQVEAVCAIEQVLEPGVVYAPEVPVALTLRPRALYDWYILNIDAETPAFPGGSPGNPGEELRLVAQETPPAGAEYVDSFPFSPLTAENTADFSLTGAEVTGKKGDTVTAAVTFANHGPAWVDNDAGSPIGVYDVGVPPGTTVTGAPEFCTPVGPDGKPAEKAGAETYRCTTPYDYVDEDTTLVREFRLRVDEVVPNATGTVGFVPGENRSGTLPFDPDPENNTATIVVNPTEGSTGGSTGGSGGTTTGGAGTGTSGTTTGGSGSGSAAGGSTAPELAASGAGGAAYLGTAAGLTVTGGLALALARGSRRPGRRRTAAHSGPGGR